MMSTDIYAWFKEIKETQENILNQLNEMLQGSSQPKVYDLPQLQEILHVSKRTIATWLQKGLLPCSRVGAKIWITDAQLHEFLEKNNNAPRKVRESKGQKGEAAHE